MTAANFAAALKYVRLDEGGNDDDPDDPGGRTSRGVTQREYDAWRRRSGLAPKDVWTASEYEIDDIYKAQYWAPFCDELPGGLDYLFFDMNVNMGLREATLLLQRGLGVHADGHVGIVTLDAAKACNPIRTIAAVTDEKTAFYRSLNTFWKFGKGWLARERKAEKRAMQMAAVAVE